MSLWLFWTVACVLFLGAIALLYWGLWGDRAKGMLRCPKCWYNMTGSFVAGKLICPECGHDARKENRLKKNHRRWIHIILSGVLLTPDLIVGWVGHGWWRQQVAATEIENLDGYVQWQSIAPDKLLKWIPQPLHLYCDRVIKVDWTNKPISDAALAHVEGLTQLQALYLTGTQMTDAGMPYLQGLAQLRSLSLWDTVVTDDGMVHLKGLSQLQWLDLDRTQVTDAGLAQLQGLTQLEWLYLNRTQVTDAGLVYLKDLTRLKELALNDTQVTDAGLVYLKGLNQLKRLHRNRSK